MLGGRRSLPEALRAPPRNPAEAKAREAKRAASPSYDPADLDLPPAMMEDAAAAVWVELAPTLKGKGTISQADVVCFTTICEILADIRTYQKQIHIEGVSIDGAHGSVVKHPLISPLNTLRGLLRSYLCEIGWTPSSRTKVASQGADKPESGTDPLDDILNSGSN